MTELTQEQQAVIDRIRASKGATSPAATFVTPEQQTVIDRLKARKADQEVGWLEGAGRTLASGATEGISTLAGLPTNVFNLFQTGVSKVLGVKPTYAPDVQKGVEDFASEQTGGYTDYEPTSMVGKGVKSFLTMAPTAVAAGMTGGASALPAALTYGAAVPAAAGTVAQPVGEAVGRIYGADNPENVGKAFKIGAELLSPSLAAKFGPPLTNVLKDPKLADVADDIGKLENFGINTTAGSIRQSQEEATKAILREVDNPRLFEQVAKQSQQFSDGVLSKVGISDDTARAMGHANGLSPVNVDRVVDKVSEIIGRNIGNTYNNAQGVNIGSIRSQVNALPGFDQLVPGQNVGEWLHAVRKQANKIKIGAPGALGESYIPKASKLIDEIDAAFARALSPDDFANLQAMNYHFSRLMTVKDALERAAKNNRTGLITPQDMMAVQGTRHTDDLTEISRLANTYLLAKGMIPSESNRKTIMKYLMDAGAGAVTGGGAALMYGADIGNAAKIALSGLAGGAGMELVQRGLRAARGSDIMQDIAKSKAMYAAPNRAIIGVAPSAQALVPSAQALGMPDRTERKAGGRVSSHEADADQLVRAAERAKKGWSAQTEPLLNHSDEHIVHALDVANRSI